VWLATAAMLFAALQLVSALAMYGKLPRVTPGDRTGTVHRWSGRIVFLLSIPVAVHCLYALGFQATDARVMVHSLLGSFFFGAFTTKMLVLTRPERPAWIVPVVGGVTFAAVIGISLTSALWFFFTFGVRF
jgi:hypothetical protein